LKKNVTKLYFGLNSLQKPIYLKKKNFKTWLRKLMN